MLSCSRRTLSQATTLLASKEPCFPYSCFCHSPFSSVQDGPVTWLNPQPVSSTEVSKRIYKSQYYLSNWSYTRFATTQEEKPLSTMIWPQPSKNSCQAEMGRVEPDWRLISGSKINKQTSQSELTEKLKMWNSGASEPTTFKIITSQTRNQGMIALLCSMSKTSKSL